MMVILGPPGSGKTTQALRVSDVLGMHPVSIGELLRTKTREATKYAASIAEGRFVSDAFTIQVLEEHLAGLTGSLILDGFPRTAEQAHRLNSIDGRLNHCIVFVLEVSEANLVRRLTSRAYIEDRPDDTPEAIALRLSLFTAHVQPVLAECVRSGHDVHLIDGSADPTNVTKAILERVSSQ